MIISTHWYNGQSVGSMFRETGLQSQAKSHQKLKKWYLMPPCLTLSIIIYGSRVSGEIQGKE